MAHAGREPFANYRGCFMLRRVLLYVLLVYSYTGVYAEPEAVNGEATGADDPAAAEAAPPEDAVEPDPEPDPDGTPQTTETFTPSEQISEDLSVSFPADI